MRVSCRLCTLEVAEAANRSPVEILSVPLPVAAPIRRRCLATSSSDDLRTPVSSDSVKGLSSTFASTTGERLARSFCLRFSIVCRQGDRSYSALPSDHRSHGTLQSPFCHNSRGAPPVLRISTTSPGSEKS
ncbi:MAG: hypothetical protein ACI9JD_001264 [Rhodococcus sp. (in: high G+C Gram-positive bacteria)]|jgi:hypothetical protein